jgi:hypothetical protein
MLFERLNCGLVHRWKQDWRKVTDANSKTRAEAAQLSGPSLTLLSNRRQQNAYRDVLGRTPNPKLTSVNAPDYNNYRPITWKPSGHCQGTGSRIAKVLCRIGGVLISQPHLFANLTESQIVSQRVKDRYKLDRWPESAALCSNSTACSASPKASRCCVGNTGET